MIRVKLRVKTRYTGFIVSVIAPCIHEAVMSTRARYNTNVVSLVLPLDDDFFVRDTSRKPNGNMKGENGESKDQQEGGQSIRSAAS